MAENPPAFPMGNPEQGGYDGMTLRDWFAGQALTGLCANQRSTQEWIGNDAVASAYVLADAMLAHREIGKGHA